MAGLIKGVPKKEYYRLYYQFNKEKIRKRLRVYQKKYYLKHRWRILKRVKLWRENHREWSKNYYLLNRENLCKKSNERAKERLRRFKSLPEEKQLELMMKYTKKIMKAKEVI